MTTVGFEVPDDVTDELQDSSTEEKKCVDSIRGGAETRFFFSVPWQASTVSAGEYLRLVGPAASMTKQ